MMNKCNKCLPPSVITLPSNRGGQKLYRGEQKKFARFKRCYTYFAPPPLGVGEVDVKVSSYPGLNTYENFTDTGRTVRGGLDQFAKRGVGGVDAIFLWSPRPPLGHLPHKYQVFSGAPSSHILKFDRGTFLTNIKFFQGHLPHIY